MAKARRRSAFARVLLSLLVDILCIGVGLCVFALFHHVLPMQGILVVDTRVEGSVDPELANALEGLSFATLVPASSPTPAPTPTPTAKPTSVPTKEPQPTPTNGPVAAVPLPTSTPAPIASLSPSQPSEVRLAVFPGEAISRLPESELSGIVSDAADQGDFSALFDSRVPLVDQVRAEENEYISDDIYLRIHRNDTGKVVFYVADIYVRNIENLRTAFANDTFGRAQRAYAWDISMDNRAILSVNGDYYSARDDGIVIRNGATYRDSLYQDVCVLYRDGEMAVYSPEEFNLASVQERGAWQAWSFGPSLLDSEGNAQKLFQSTVVNHNPRCGIGYFEPGHYCFVVVEGRNDDSAGVTLAEFSLIFQKLGCTVAYNMDGGNTAVMTYGKRLVSQPSQGGRAVSDIIMVAEVDTP